MAKRICRHFAVFCVVAVLSVPVSALPSSGSNESLFSRLKRIVVRILDDAKLVIPPG